MKQGKNLAHFSHCALPKEFNKKLKLKKKKKPEKICKVQNL